ncbi:hypothetical protein P168DRAFT_307234 [Aspergillus campestris IBT 28561]|uniref:ER-bound oxygenase mpaB/mpaB'/Rubber oxygenase catalytic domain-containing protein n=1 Tax=Aspergillus campestris (strain IBT 28561) TaxID=1392248 RepID=A0A2I1CT25_ASPC2|nr:uncharacterized protein P168DRAFT_307234 [Aspergillus campestris IBT 28561]PKY00786.1 hypothetical protein P168DRAFT_307234 [Aspergillus campestris IBT 28561]
MAEVEKNMETPQLSQTASTDSASSTKRLDQLEQLEMLPQILQEGALFAGAGSALLLQAAYPGIRHGESNGELATELVDSLQATLSYISCLVFGTRAEKQTLLGLLARNHPPLKASESIRQNTPAHLWVAATLYATATDFYQRIYGRVNYRTAEAAYAEFTVLMHSLGLPSGSWPPTRHAFWRYWDEQIDQLVVTDEGHRFAQELMHHTAVPRWVSPLKPMMRVITIEMLPPSLREAYGLKSTMGSRGLYRTTMGEKEKRKDYRSSIPNKSTRIIDKILREQLISRINQSLQLVDILAGQQSLEVLGGVAAEEDRAALDDGLQVVEGLRGEELFHAVEQGGELVDEAWGGGGEEGDGEGEEEIGKKDRYREMECNKSRLSSIHFPVLLKS